MRKLIRKAPRQISETPKESRVSRILERLRKQTVKHPVEEFADAFEKDVVVKGEQVHGPRYHVLRKHGRAIE